MGNIAMWCGIAGVASSILAVIILFLTRKNILDIIDKEVIIFEGNFGIKKDAISTALNLIDHIVSKGKQITLNPEFAQRAKQSYNDLMCVLTNIKVAEEFYEIAINQSSYVDDTRIENFKIMCRKDIGLKGKFKKAPKHTQNQTNFQPTLNNMQSNTTIQKPVADQKRSSK